VAVLALAVAAYAVERAGAARGDAGSEASASRSREADDRRRPLELGLLLLAAVLGALLFAGSLAEGHRSGLPGALAGVLCAALGWLALAGLLTRARRRLDPSAASLVTVYADALALALAAASIFVPPASFLALAALAVLAVRARAEGARKFEGLRILR
jgi:hypothetical protein